MAVYNLFKMSNLFLPPAIRASSSVFSYEISKSTEKLITFLRRESSRSVHRSWILRQSQLPGSSFSSLALLQDYKSEVKQILFEEDESLSEAVKWFTKVFDYNLQSGKLIRGTTVVEAYRLLCAGSPEATALKAACVLGWCVEMLQAFFLVHDDIMDQSTLRRGLPCWYTKPDVGLIAINDGVFLYSGIFRVLSRALGHAKCYNDVLHEFLKVIHQTIYGQCLDMLSSSAGGDTGAFSLRRYETIVRHKTSHYTFCLPLHLAMHLVGDFAENDFMLMQKLGFKLGFLFQAQDDFLDCYGDPVKMGKKGVDIQEGKCTWLAATYIDQASETQKAAFKEHYGVAKEESVQKIKSLYADVSMEKQYVEFEARSYEDTSLLIADEIGNPALKNLAQDLLELLYKRQK